MLILPLGLSNLTFLFILFVCYLVAIVENINNQQDTAETFGMIILLYICTERSQFLTQYTVTSLLSCRAMLTHN